MKADESKKTGWRRAARLARAAAVAILSLYALYLIAINVFLSTSLFPKVVNSDPVTIDIHYSRAWSILPGRIHAKDLAIRSSDSSVEWLLRLDEVTFDVKFLPLVQRRFEITRARGRGISMRARRKLDAWPYEVEQVANLPPIYGYPAFSVRPCGPPHPERWDDSWYALWTGRLEDVIAEDVREVWVDGARFEGSARVTGRFYLKPLRAAEVGPAHVDVRDGGKVSVGPFATTVLATSVGGTIDVRVDRFDPREIAMDAPTPDKSLLRFVTIGTELRARFADASTLPTIFDRRAPLYVAGLVDAQRIALRVDRGRFKSGTRVDLASQKMSFVTNNVIGSGSFALVTEVIDDVLLAHAEARDVTLVRADALNIIHVPVVHVEGDAHELDLAAANPLGDAHAMFDVARASLPDASVLNIFIPEENTPLAIVNGEAHTLGQLEAWRADRRVSGSGELHADHLDVRVAKMRVRGAFDVAGSFGAFRANENRLEDAKLGVTISRVSLSSDRAPDSVMTTAKNVVADVTAARVKLDDPLESLEASFRMLDGEITDRTLLRQYLPKGEKLQLNFGHTRFVADGHVTVEEHLARGDVHARSKEFGMTLGNMQLLAGVEVNARVHDWHWEKGDLAIDQASVDVSRLTMTTQEGAVLASIDRLHVGATSPAFTFSDPFARVSLDASFHGEVKDPVALNAFLPDGATYGLAAENGGARAATFSANAHLAVVNHIARGRASASASAMGIRTKPVTLLGETSVATNIERWDMDASRLSLTDSRASITNVRGKVGRVTHTARAPEGRAGRNGDSRELSATQIELVGSATDLDMARPTLRGVDARFRLQDAELPDARVLAEILPPGNALQIKSGNAHASGEVEISSSKRTASGEIALEVVKAGVTFHETYLSGDFGIRVPVRGFDPDTSSLDISGTHIAIRDVEVRNAAAETVRWRSDIRLDDATMRFDDRGGGGGGGGKGPRLDGMVKLTADDARPILGVLLRNGLPKFVVDLVDMPQLALRARLHFAPHVLLISDIYGRGGDVAIRGSYGIVGEEPSGAFVVSKGPLAMGIRLAKDGTTHPRFFRLDKWIAEEDANVKAKAAAGSSSKMGQNPGLD